MRERKSLRSQVDSHSFTLSENGRALYLSDITCVRSKMIFSPEFNVAISVGMHWQKPKLAHMPTNVNQYLHSITVSMYLSAGADWPSGEPVPGGLAANLARCPAFIYFLYNLLLLFYIVVVVFVAYRMY